EKELDCASQQNVLCGSFWLWGKVSRLIALRSVITSQQPIAATYRASTRDRPPRSATRDSNNQVQDDRATLLGTKAASRNRPNQTSSEADAPPHPLSHAKIRPE